MFNGNIISVDTSDHHSIFMDLFRNELERMLNTLLLAELTEFLSYDKYDVSGYNTGNSRNGIMNVPCILFSVILRLKYLVIDWINFKINYLHRTIEILVILKK